MKTAAIGAVLTLALVLSAPASAHVIPMKPSKNLARKVLRQIEYTANGIGRLDGCWRVTVHRIDCLVDVLGQTESGYRIRCSGTIRVTLSSHRDTTLGARPFTKCRAA